TFRFKETDDKSGKISEQINTVVGTIYIKKSALGESPPDEITVKVEW
ncbi:hypothetical protein LCGC14_1393400, partial [marine sediment metagenome]